MSGVNSIGGDYGDRLYHGGDKGPPGTPSVTCVRFGSWVPELVYVLGRMIVGEAAKSIVQDHSDATFRQVAQLRVREGGVDWRTWPEMSQEHSVAEGVIEQLHGRMSRDYGIETTNDILDTTTGNVHVQMDPPLWVVVPAARVKPGSEDQWLASGRGVAGYSEFGAEFIARSLCSKLDEAIGVNWDRWFRRKAVGLQ